MGVGATCRNDPSTRMPEAPGRPEALQSCFLASGTPEARFRVCFAAGFDARTGTQLEIFKSLALGEALSTATFH